MWKYPPEQILVPIDFGNASKRAIDVAAALARHYQARLRLLHAETFEAPAYFTHEQVAIIERERVATRSVAKRHAMAFANLGAVPFAVDVVQSPPADAILDAAYSADLIVMGTHGRRGPSRWWLGSVAERVTRDATAPVLVVRAAAAGDTPENLFARPMMVAGPDALDAAAARYVQGLAHAFGGEVVARTATCEADVAREQNASMLVVAKPHSAAPWFGDSVERMLRSCALPMLFVPGR